MPTIKLVEKQYKHDPKVLPTWSGDDYTRISPNSDTINTFTTNIGGEKPEGRVTIDFGGIDPKNREQILLIMHLEYQGKTLVSNSRMYLSHKGRGGLVIYNSLYLIVELVSPIRDPNWERNRSLRRKGTIEWTLKPDRHIHNHDYKQFIEEMRKSGLKLGTGNPRDPWKNRNMI